MSFLARIFGRQKPSEKADHAVNVVLPDGILLVESDEFGMPRPDWDAVAAWIGDQSPAEQSHYWNAAKRHWLGLVGATYDAPLIITENDSFMLLHHPKEHNPPRYLAYLGRVHQRLRLLLGDLIAQPSGCWPIILFPDFDEYEKYTAFYFPEFGEYGLSGGMFIQEAGGQIALPHQDFAMSEATLAHEMTHAALSDLPLPRWLDEGMAVVVENTFVADRRYPEPFQEQRKQREFWDSENIQDFWTGDSFMTAGDGQEESYNLAHFLVGMLLRERDKFMVFLANAHWKDAGESAVREAYGVSLEQLAGTYLGEDDWAPQIEQWEVNAIEDQR